MPVMVTNFSKQLIAAINNRDHDAIDSLLDRCVENPQLERDLAKAGPALADALLMTAESKNRDRCGCVIRAAQHNNLGEILIDRLTGEALSFLRAGEEREALNRLSVLEDMPLPKDCYPPLVDASDRAMDALRNICKESAGEIQHLAAIIVDRVTGEKDHPDMIGSI